MISENEKQALVRMFCAYCRRTLRNANTDILRREARQRRRETVFSDMPRRELFNLIDPVGMPEEEEVFNALGYEIGVLDERLADALSQLTDTDRAIVLLYYFAGWTDKRIAEETGYPRSTVQFRRARALGELAGCFRREGGCDDL